MKLFISYRRNDSTHAAARVRMCLEQKFGAEAVFIDREIPAGKRWEDYLEEMLQQCDGVVVLVGDEFMRLLTKHLAQGGDRVDPLVWEIATAIKLKRTIYPVLFGAIDMPDPAQLPESIRGLAGFQAVFAREPAFDSAVDVLIKSIAANHQWSPPATPPAPAAAITPAAASPLGMSWPWVWLLGLAAVWGLGRLVIWLADPASVPQRGAESAFWHGLRYVLATVLWGLGPYFAYWLVAELRARARLPIFNLHGLLSVFNVGGMLVAGGTFLLLSTLPGWRLQPWLVFPEQPLARHYVVLSLALLAIVLAAVAVAVWEPRVRSLAGRQRVWGMRVVNGTSGLLVLCGLWFAVSLAHSVPRLGAADPVTVVGYLMLCPALSVLTAGWQFGQAQLGPRDRQRWQIVALLWLVLALYAACTLALFAYGPTRVLASGI